MKKILLFLLMGCFVLNTGCNQNSKQGEDNSYDGQDEEITFSYKVIIDSSSYLYEYCHDDLRFRGIAVMINRNGYDDYVVFDDECSYDSYVYEWYRAFIVAKYLVEKNIELSCKQIENYLKYSYCLPNCLNESNEVSDEIKRTILNAYYDIQDKELYEPERSYGFHNYRTVQVARLENKKINIPIGTLVVGNLVGYASWDRWWEESRY